MLPTHVRVDNVYSDQQNMKQHKIVHDSESETLTTSMKQDLEAILSKYGMEECKPGTTPAVPNKKLMRAYQISV